MTVKPVPQLTIALAAVVDRAVNIVLSADPEGRSGFAELEGRSVLLEVEGWDLRFILRPQAHGVRIAACSHDAAEVPGGSGADVVIVGTPGALFGLAGRTDAAAGMLPDDLRITGDVAVAQALSRAAARLDIDWEALLARATGDMAAHRIARGARTTAKFGRETLERLLEQGGEYLREESEVAARGHEIELYATEVDRLRDDAARLEQKIARLESRVEPRRA
ncbi:MAG: ubiquinone biosynthesis accessory factor UbiJ [Gammaproteobacteria bacterium]